MERTDPERSAGRMPEASALLFATEKVSRQQGETNLSSNSLIANESKTFIQHTKLASPVSILLPQESAMNQKSCPGHPDWAPRFATRDFLIPLLLRGSPRKGREAGRRAKRRPAPTPSAQPASQSRVYSKVLTTRNRFPMVRPLSISLPSSSITRITPGWHSSTAPAWRRHPRQSASPAHGRCRWRPRAAAA